MLSEHEFVVAIRDRIYPKIVEIERECIQLYNKKYYPGIGPTGFSCSCINEYDYSIQLLESIMSLLQKLDYKKGIM